MMRMSVPFSKRWVAKLCRRVCTVTRAARFAAVRVERPAEAAPGMDRLALVRAVNSQSCGRAASRGAGP